MPARSRRHELRIRQTRQGQRTVGQVEQQRFQQQLLQPARTQVPGAGLFHRRPGVRYCLRHHLLRRGNLSAPGRPGPYLCPSCPQTGKARKFHLPSGAGVFLGGPGLCRRPADLLPGNAAFADEKRSLSGQVRQDDGAGVRHGLPGIHGNGLWILY